MNGPSSALAGIAALALFFVVVPAAAAGLWWYGRRRAVVCPTTGAKVSITATPLSAALVEIRGTGGLRVGRCDLWPELGACAQGCLRPAQPVDS